QTEGLEWAAVNERVAAGEDGGELLAVALEAEEDDAIAPRHLRLHARSFWPIAEDRQRGVADVQREECIEHHVPALFHREAADGQKERPVAAAEEIAAHGFAASAGGEVLFVDAEGEVTHALDPVRRKLLRLPLRRGEGGVAAARDGANPCPERL